MDFIAAPARESTATYSFLPLNTVASLDFDDDKLWQESSAETPVHLRKADVLQWFQQSAQSDAAWVLNRLAETLPHLVFETLSGKLSSMSQQQTQMNDMLASVEEGVQATRKSRKAVADFPTGDPVIQFTSSIYYAEEGVDNIMVIDVMRIGDQSKTSEVFYATEDDSAISGRSYVATSGKLVFEPEVALQHIEIPIIDNELWDTTLEFKCRLKQEGSKFASLGAYLYHTRVKIIDNNHFPTDSFRDLNTPKQIAECSKWPLLFGFFAMVSSIPKVWRATIKYIVIDMLHNTWDLLWLFMNVYILDYIVEMSNPENALILIHDRRSSLLLCSFIFVANIAVFHALDYVRLSLPIKAPATNFVQAGMLRKFLNYKKWVREHLQPGSVLMGQQRDVADLINLGYLNLLQMIKALGELFIMLIFKLITPLVFGSPYDWKTFFLLFFMPATLMIFVRCREEITSRALHARNDAQDDFANQIEVTTMHYSLVIDYSLRNHCEYKFLDKQQKFRYAEKKTAQILENNHYFCKWITSLVVAIWLVYGGLQVIDGSLTVGLFVTNLKLFQWFGGSFLQIYKLTVEMMQTFPALVNITTLMNLPTDVRHRRILKRAQREQVKQYRQQMFEAVKKNCVNAVPIDIVPLVVSFHYPFKFEGKNSTLNFKGHVEIHQGQMVAVVGPIGCGKATLLRLISGSVLPEEGKESPIFVPSHLRVASVADDAIFFDGTLYDNLTFGLDRSQPHASRERVKKIVGRLTQVKSILDYLDADVESAWLDIFSGSQCKLLSVARALIHNVEVVTIHKPLARLTHNDAESIIQTLHDHIENKGLDIIGDAAKRRPRTVIVSAASDKIAQHSHNVIIVHPTFGIKLAFPDSEHVALHSQTAPSFDAAFDTVSGI